MKLFGLTDREAALTALLADGYKLDDAAGRLGIGRETARTHLARALDKTATERQTDLVRLTLAAVPPIAASHAIGRQRGLGSTIRPEAANGTNGWGCV